MFQLQHLLFIYADDTSESRAKTPAAPLTGKSRYPADQLHLSLFTSSMSLSPGL